LSVRGRGIYESDTRRGLYIWKVRARETRGPTVKLDSLLHPHQTVEAGRVVRAAGVVEDRVGEVRVVN
jgi:hypothetical protein